MGSCERTSREWLADSPHEMMSTPAPSSKEAIPVAQQYIIRTARRTSTEPKRSAQFMESQLQTVMHDPDLRVLPMDEADGSVDVRDSRIEISGELPGVPSGAWSRFLTGGPVSVIERSQIQSGISVVLGGLAALGHPREAEPLRLYLESLMSR